MDRRFDLISYGTFSNPNPIGSLSDLRLLTISFVDIKVLVVFLGVSKAC